jgi:cellulase/cellobiase CelA1
MAIAAGVLLVLYLMPGSDGPPQLANDAPRPKPSKASTPQASAARGVKAEYAIRGKWKEGFNAEMTVTNLTSQPISGWTVQLEMPPNVDILDTWAAQATQKATSVTLRSQPWNTYLAPGTAIRFGFQAKCPANLGAATPRACTINGSPC